MPRASTKGAAVPLPLTTVFQMVAAGRIAQQLLERELEEHGLTLRHVGALGHLANRPDLSYSDLARRAGVTAQSMHATVRQLEEIGAVRRELAGHGHRARLEVTGAGRELLAVASAAAQRVDADLLGGLGPANRTAVSEFLAGLAMRGFRGAE